MKLFVSLMLVLFAYSLEAQNFEKRPKPSIEQALPLLEPLKKEAIVVGHGKTDVYVFVDPFCPRSRDFVSMIFENKKMQNRYKYYFFLYRLERFDSSELIENIYSAADPVRRMYEIMAEHKPMKLALLPKREVSDKIARIAKVGAALDVYKRPYLIIDKKAKKAR